MGNKKKKYIPFLKSLLKSLPKDIFLLNLLFLEALISPNKVRFIIIKWIKNFSFIVITFP